MGKKLLREFYELCEGGICQDLLTEREKREVQNGALYLSGRLQTCEKKNGKERQSSSPVSGDGEGGVQALTTEGRQQKEAKGRKRNRVAFRMRTRGFEGRRTLTCLMGWSTVKSMSS